jgi:hypothetical protein
MDKLIVSEACDEIKEQTYVEKPVLQMTPEFRMLMYKSGSN